MKGWTFSVFYGALQCEGIQVWNSFETSLNILQNFFLSDGFPHVSGRDKRGDKYGREIEMAQIGQKQFNSFLSFILHKTFPTTFEWKFFLFHLLKHAQLTRIELYAAFLPKNMGYFSRTCNSGGFNELFRNFLMRFITRNSEGLLEYLQDISNSQFVSLLFRADPLFAPFKM